MKACLKSLRLYLLVFLLPVGIQTPAMGDQAEAAMGPDNNSQDQAMQLVKEELADVERRWYGLARVRLGYPQTLSAGLGAIFVEQPKNADCSIGCTLYGWHFEVEPGIAGLQGSVGWGKLVAETGRTKRLLHTVRFGWAVRGIVMRTWGESHYEIRDKTWAGVEANFSVIQLNFSLGLMHSVSSDSTQEWLVSGGLGWGF